MLTITDVASLSRALAYPLDAEVARLLLERQRQLGGNLHDIARFIVIQPFDRPRSVAKAVGFSLFENPVDGTRWREPDYTPAFEFIEDHGFAYELTMEFTSDFTNAFFIEKAPGVHPDFLDFCRHYAPHHA